MPSRNVTFKKGQTQKNIYHGTGFDFLRAQSITPIRNGKFDNLTSSEVASIIKESEPHTSENAYGSVRQAKLESAYNVKITRSASRDWTPPPQSATQWAIRRQSTGHQSKISELLAQNTDNYESPVHVLGANRRLMSSHAKDIPFLKQKFDYK
jgi:hypothetical protein